MLNVSRFWKDFQRSDPTPHRVFWLWGMLGVPVFTVLTAALLHHSGTPLAFPCDLSYLEIMRERWEIERDRIFFHDLPLWLAVCFFALVWIEFIRSRANGFGYAWGIYFPVALFFSVPYAYLLYLAIKPYCID